MQFDYTAKTADGKTVTGRIDAPSKLAAADKLYAEQQLTVMELVGTDAESRNAATGKVAFGSETASMAPAAAGPGFVERLGSFFANLNEIIIDMSGVPSKEKVIFFRLLAVMINAGLPIVKALGLMAEQTKQPRLKKILANVKSDIESGRSLSDALGEYNDVFTDAELGVISSGEASGQLNRALLDLATTSEKSESLKGKIKSALMYPVIILVIVVGVTVVVMTMVVPKLADLFTSAGANLPASTRTLMAMSDWFMSSTMGIPNWLFFFLIIGAIVAGISAFKKSENGKFVWDQLMLRAPIFGTLIQKVALAALSRQLSTLTASGLSIIKALEITANAVGNEVYRRSLLAIRADVESGVSINQAIRQQGAEHLYPPLIVSMITIGEQTAQLSTVMQKVADFYDEEVDTFVKNLSTIMEPMIIVIVGALVGGLVAAIMQPIMQIADVASQQ